MTSLIQHASASYWLNRDKLFESRSLKRFLSLSKSLGDGNFSLSLFILNKDSAQACQSESGNPLAILTF